MEYWHIMNRGVDKRDVFLDEKDYLRFIRDMYFFNDKNYVSSSTRKNTQTNKTELAQQREKIVSIHAFCLMPNHYHLLISATSNDFSNISLFMKKLNKGYSQAFNRRYGRTGALWQGKYKKVLVTTDQHFLHLPHYIHYNPLDLHSPEWREGTLNSPKKALDFLNRYKWSSYLDYVGINNFPSVLDALDIPSHKITKHTFHKNLNNKMLLLLSNDSTFSLERNAIG